MRRLALATCLAATAIPAAAADLSLKRVMLSAAGVGYFEFAGQVDGTATVGLDVPLDQVDDVLNSLAVFDDHGGVGSLELPGRDSTRQAFGDVPFAQAMLDSPAALLASLRGEEVSVSGPQAMTGRIVTAVQEPTQSGAGIVRRQMATVTRVTLLTADGLRQFILEDAASVQLTDPTLRTRVGAALDAARQQAASASRHLALKSAGQGSRTVNVGYVVAAPLWKATYRLVLPARPGDTARVQGWAVLENQSGADWKAVDLTLHAGNPVTFHQAIYASYYADRPEVPVEILGRILPAPDEQVMVKAEPMRRRFGMQGPEVPAQVAIPAPGAALDRMTDAAAAPVMAPAAMAPPATQTETAETPLDTTFHIPIPVDLARGHTASVPILDRDMPAQQLDWLQADSDRPVSAIRLTNEGDAGLPAGILALYTAGATQAAAFAGDARLSSLPAGETRLLGFAEDLRTTATRTTSPAPDTLLRVTIANGVLHRSLRHRAVTTVRLTAPAREPRRVLVEFPRVPDATFSLDGGAIPGQEETAHAWRVPFDLKPGETKTITGYTDTTEITEDDLLTGDGDLDGSVLMQVVNGNTTDPAARAKLQPLFALRGDLASKQAALKHLTDDQAAALADEERVRNNLRVVAGPGDLHTRLLAALDADETRLAALSIEIAHAQNATDAAKAALSDAVGKLSL